MRNTFLALLCVSFGLVSANDELSDTLPHNKLDLGNGYHVVLEHPKMFRYTLSLLQNSGQKLLLWDMDRDTPHKETRLSTYGGIEAGIKVDGFITVLLRGEVGGEQLLQFDLNAKHPFIREDYPGCIFSGFAVEPKEARSDESPVKVVFDSLKSFHIEFKDPSFFELPALKFELGPNGQFYLNGNAYDPITTNLLHAYSTILKRPLSRSWDPKAFAKISQSHAAPTSTPLPPAPQNLKHSAAPTVPTPLGKEVQALESKPLKTKPGPLDLTRLRLLCLLCLAILIAIVWIRQSMLFPAKQK